jgi:ABC-type dipeptide/oligopeptide/nickel transport system permease component
MGRMTFVLRRLLQLVPVAIGCTIVVFFMIHLIPGDPARTILGIHATPKAVALLHKEWGLNRPLIGQYWLFMDRLLHGNLAEPDPDPPAADPVADHLLVRPRRADQRAAGDNRGQPQGRRP